MEKAKNNISENLVELTWMGLEKYSNCTATKKDLLRIVADNELANGSQGSSFLNDFEGAFEEAFSGIAKSCNGEKAESGFMWYACPPEKSCEEVVDAYRERLLELVKPDGKILIGRAEAPQGSEKVVCEAYLFYLEGENLDLSEG